MRSDYVPRRIVSLQPSATAIVRELGQLERLVACTKYCVEICPEMSERPVVIVSDSWSAQSQQLRDVNPDLVIASVPYQEKAVIEILKAGTTFLGLAPRKLDDVYSDVALIAGLLQVQARGAQVIEAMQKEIESVRTRTKHLAKLRVFCEEWGKPIIASQPWVAELVEAAGGEFLGVPGRQITPEEVTGLQPDVVIAAWCGAGDRVPLEKIVTARQWTTLPAAKNHRVYCIRDEYLNTPAPTLLHGLHALAAAIHPAHFPQPQGLRWIGKTN
jgi:iron complex transport system substrate-binding protein